MGRNNQQRRAAKKRNRTERDQIAAKQRPVHVDSADGLQSGGPRPPPRAVPDQVFEVRELIDRLVLLTFSDHDKPQLALGIERLIARRSAVASRRAIYDQQATRLLTGIVSTVYERGWQPSDLIHVVRRKNARLVPFAGAVVSEQARLEDAAVRAPQEWLSQLQTLDDEIPDLPEPAMPGLFETPQARPASPSAPQPFLVADWHTNQGLDETSAWWDVLTLAGMLRWLPRLPLLVPPPSQWDGGGQTRPRVRVGGAPTSPKLLNRIRGLLSKAEATEFAAEAEAFTAKAQDLMARHAIDEALLQADAHQPIDVISRRVHLESPYAGTKVRLLQHVGAANRVKVVWSSEYAIATAVGTPVDVEQVEMLFTSLLIQATRAMTEAGGSSPAWGSRSNRSAPFRRAFLTAYAVRIGERLCETNEHAAETYGKALVPVLARQSAAVDDHFEHLFPHTTTVRSTYLDARGWEAGRSAADRAVFVTGQVEN